MVPRCPKALPLDPWPRLLAGLMVGGLLWSGAGVTELPWMLSWVATEGAIAATLPTVPSTLQTQASPLFSLTQRIRPEGYPQTASRAEAVKIALRPGTPEARKGGGGR